MTTKPTISLELSAKPTFLASWRPRRPLDGLTDAQDGLLTPDAQDGSSRLRRPLDGPPGAQDGFWMSLLAPKTASGWASDAKTSWRPRRPLDGLTDAQDGLLTPKTAFGRAY